MCGIAGIMFKNGGAGITAGRALIDMLDGCQHRGPDSTGFALYGESRPGLLRLRFFVGGPSEAPEAIDRIRAALAAEGAEIVEDERIGSSYRVAASFEGDVQKLSYAMEHAAKVISIGASLDIVKDVGRAHDVDDTYHVSRFEGSHGLGHVRLATESDVKPEAAHPFWATGFADVAIVHNGQITNYWKMRRRLERRGFEFNTDNDSELIAVYLAHHLERDADLERTLHRALEDLDGTFTFLVSTPTGLGCAKDKWSAKPLVIMERHDVVAVASEEVALRQVFPEEIERFEPQENEVMTWSI